MNKSRGHKLILMCQGFEIGGGQKKLGLESLAKGLLLKIEKIRKNTNLKMCQMMCYLVRVKILLLFRFFNRLVWIE